MTYGSNEWADWVLSEEESLKHIKAAYDLGINTFEYVGLSLKAGQGTSAY